MLKKILAAAAAAVIAASMSGCSYTMTEEDLALQKSLVGYWAADNSTGYNEFDEDGNLISMTAVEFTDDFNYLLHIYMPSYDAAEPSYVMTNPPVSYIIKDGKFCVNVDGVDQYAGITISDGGYTMNWITNESTDLYLRFSAEEAAAMGIPVYDPESWKETESAPGDESAQDTEENGAEDTSANEVGADSAEDNSEE